MSEQIDWSKAPKWATHALEKLHEPDRNLVYWSFFVDGEHRVEPNGLWYHPDGYRIIQSRPTTPSWSGEGLPPVGVVCEMHYCGEWEKTEILCIGVKHVFIRQIAVTGEEFECSLNLSACQFRPIRTPEQIAADERDKDAHELFRSAWPETHSWGDLSPHWQEAFYRLADAGYRKP